MPEVAGKIPMLIKKDAEKPVRYIIESNYRITLYSASLLRVEFSRKGLWDDETPLITEPSFDEDVPHKIKNVNKYFIVSTKYFEMKLLPNGLPPDVGSFYFKIKDKNFIWQPGVADDKNAGGTMLDLYKYPEGKSSERFTEGLISKNGYFIYRNPCEFLWDPDKNWIKKRQDWEFCDWYLFAYGKDFRRGFLDFIKLFGRIPLPPKWAFGYWYSKWHRFSAEEALNLVKRIKAENIPLDVFVIDTDWRKNVWCGYQWNNELFPDHKKFLAELKSYGLHTCLNDHPGYGVSDELPPDDPFREKIKNRIPDINEFRIRWSDERYVYSWLEEIFIKFLNDGIDLWWVDGWGATNGIMDLSMQLWLNRFYFEAAKRAQDGRRPLILSRWGGIGSHKYPIQFSGDTHSSFETLKYQISFTHKGGNIGAAYWSHDIGGFLGDKIPDDLFIRWIQFGCFSPIFRTHSCGGPREPWNYSPKALKIFKKYLNIRYALVPYFYGLARECYDSGFPLIRGLYFEYPEDKNAYLYDNEYLIGNSLLVAPAYGPGKYFEREIYFPTGEWFALEDGRAIKGPCIKKFKIPLEKIPVFVKTGSIIPSSPVKGNLNGTADEIELNIFPDKKTEYLLYEDDGKSEGYKRGEYAIRKITVEKSGNRIKINILPVSGIYQGTSEKSRILLNVFLKGKKARTSSADGNIIPQNYTKNIFSGTVKQKYKFLNIDLGICNSADKKEIIISV